MTTYLSKICFTVKMIRLFFASPIISGHKIIFIKVFGINVGPILL